MENKEFSYADFKNLFDSQFDSIKNYIYYQCGNIQLAEDIVQESFVKLWEMRHKVKPETVKALVYKISSNALINHIKHSKIQMKFEAKFKIDIKTSENPQFILEKEEFERKYYQVLNSMSENDRIVFLMNRIDELTYNDIAERLGLSVKAIEKRMHNALQHLRKHINFKF